MKHKKIFLLVCSFTMGLIIPQISQGQVLDTVFQNSFEEGFGGPLNGNCGYEWERTSDSAAHGDYSLRFRSSVAPGGCYNFAGRESFSSENIQPQDTFFIRTLFYLSKGTADETDASFILLYDDNDQSVHEFYLPRSTSAYQNVQESGWYTITSTIPGQKILDSTSSTNFNVLYFASSGGNGKDMGLDNVRFFHKDNFRAPNITINKPNPFDNLKVAQRTTIGWEINETVGEQVDIEYSTNGGTNWATIENDVDASLGTYEWVPNAPTSNPGSGLIRILNASDRSYGDTVEDLTIESGNSPALTLIQPKANDTFKTNTEVGIEWVANDQVALVDIEFSDDDGNTWKEITTDLDAGEGSYNWTAPSNPIVNAQVRVIDADNASIVDRSGTFQIVDEIRTLSLNQPQSGDTLNGGTTYAIKWTASQDVSQVMLELSKDGGNSWNEIAANVTAGKATYNWEVPDENISEAVIRITDEDDASVTTESGNFYIDGSTGIKDIERLTSVNVYPNPAANQISVQLPSEEIQTEVQIQLFNMEGQRIQEFNSSIKDEALSYDISNLSKGLYYIKISGNSHHYVGKFVKR